jgi:HK97 family phage prohead protease
MNNRKELSGQLRQVSDTEKGEKIFTFVASTADPDRHRTVLNQSNWILDNFNSNPVIGYQHNLYGDLCNAPDPDDVIGKGRAYVEDGSLMVDITFDDENEKAKKVESKVDRGFLNTVSVGFIEVGEGRSGERDLGEDPELYYFSGQELLEVSIVNIPSNPKAKKKSLRDQTFTALQYIYRELGGQYSFSDIEKLTVRQILDKLNGKEEKKKAIVKKVYEYKQI